MGSTTRYPYGVTNRDKEHVLGRMGQLDPTKFHTYFNDFDDLAQFNGITDTASWDVHATGAGTFALADGDGGLALITNAAADDDCVFFQKKGESFKFVAGKQLWLSGRFKVSDATESDVLFGLAITDATPLDATDGVFFRKDDGDTNLDIVVVKNGTATSAVAATLVADTFIEVGFYYNGKDAVEYWIDGEKIGSSVDDNLPDDEELTLTFGVQNGEAVAKTMTLDWFFAAKER